MKGDAHLSFPVAHQPGRRHDQDAPEEPTTEHLPDVEARHNGLSGAGIVCQEKPQARLREHVVVDGNDLMGERINQRGFRAEHRTEQVPVAKALALDE